jgi:signal transduction histidine kinase
MADVPMLKAAVATGDPPTVERLTRDYPERVGCDVFIVTDARGRTLAARGGKLPSAVSSPASQGFAMEDGRLVEFFTVPITLGSDARERLGELTLGFVLDDAVAARLRSLTGSDVAIAYGGRIRATTLPRTSDPVLAAARGAGVLRLDLAGEDWVALREPLGGREGPSALVLKSRAEALRPLGTLRTALAVAALVAVAVSLLLSWAVARTVTRPLAALTNAMREIASTGDLNREIGPVRPWDDEDARLLSRTFNSLTTSIARFQKESALRDRLSALGRLSTIVAHEVRNPLMIIKGSVRSLRRPGAGPETMQEVAADIDHEVARLDRIVGDVLDFARPLGIEPLPTELAPVCRDAAAAALGGGTGLAVRHTFDPGLGEVMTDPERLRTVLVNLVANARDSVLARRECPEAGPPGSSAIEVGGRRLGDGRAVLWVADEGTGIAAADLPHVFEPFYTTKRTGTGLGLAIARKVVEALNGTIRIESREGEGTRIEVELPPSVAQSRRKEAP